MTSPPKAASRFWIERSIFGWWYAYNPDEALATMDTNTIYRAWTRDRLVAKLERKVHRWRTESERRQREEIVL